MSTALLHRCTLEATSVEKAKTELANCSQACATLMCGNIHEQGHQQLQDDMLLNVISAVR
jgi:hypothetical protein